jgi:hypothetical protein
MDQEVQPISNEAKNTVEIVVHIKEDLGEGQQKLVVSELEKTDGIIGAEFCILRNHLMLVKYDREIFSSQDVLKSFNSSNLKAKLVGPI